MYLHYDTVKLQKSNEVNKCLHQWPIRQAKNSRVDFIFHAIQNALNTYITLFLYLILKAHFFTNPVFMSNIFLVYLSTLNIY